jgi:uncharacterized membrane protein
MDKFLAGLLVVLGAIVVIALFSVIGGTIVYWIWPHVIPFAFPGLVAGGFVVAKLTWWKAVLLTWLFGLLFKGSSSSSSSKS